MSYIISNDQFIPVTEFTHEIEDGLLYGYGIFETILIKSKKARYLKEHYNRMIDGSRTLKIEVDLDYEKLKFYVEYEAWLALATISLALNSAAFVII
jgi:branched-subunit amino acid aminotransferase/4-amino-4-deoxychorismate lyase